MNNANLTAIFGRFAGKEVEMDNKQWSHDGQTYDQWVPKKNDPVLAEMHDTARQNNLSLRVWFPGMMGTMDFRTNRVNARIAQGTDGKWRIGNSFSIG